MFASKQGVRRCGLDFLLAVLGLLVIYASSAVAESTDDYSPAELEELVGPVALYPDDLIAVILPASSYPLQVVEAARYLREVENNPDLKPDEDWDDAVVALLNYPQVIDLLNEDLDWTWNLGEAVVNQQPAVLVAIQDFRSRAVVAGNLETDNRQTVSQVDEVIKITPVDEEVIYVPYYEPSRVVVYQSRPVYHYYPDAYPVYYYPYPVHYRFRSGFFWGVTTAYTIGWLTDRVHFHYYGHASHPYYGRHYTSHYYAKRAGRIRHRHYTGKQRWRTSRRNHYGRTWVPRYRHGDRPRHKRVRGDRLRTDSHRIVQNRTNTRNLSHRGQNRSRQARNERIVRDQRRSRRANSERIVAKRSIPSGNERRGGNQRRSKRVTQDKDHVRGKRTVRRANRPPDASQNTESRTPSRRSERHSSRQDRRDGQAQRNVQRSVPKPAVKQKSANVPKTRAPRVAKNTRSVDRRAASRGGRAGNRRREHK